MISEKDLKHGVTLRHESDHAGDHSRAVPHLESDSYQAWWYKATDGWPTAARAGDATPPTVVSEAGRLYVIGPDGQVRQMSETELRDYTDPLPAPAIIQPRFKRTRDGHLGAVEAG